MRLFVDVDDTLILYKGEGPHPYGVRFGEPYVANMRLSSEMTRFFGVNQDAQLFVWSGGGAQYAREVGSRFVHDLEPTFLTKDRDAFGLVSLGDIVIDDQPIKVGVEVQDPLEWKAI